MSKFVNNFGEMNDCPMSVKLLSIFFVLHILQNNTGRLGNIG